MIPKVDPEDERYVNQKGLNRKVSLLVWLRTAALTDVPNNHLVEHLRCDWCVLDLTLFPTALTLLIDKMTDHSLRRLQLDYVDLLQCHRFDANTPIAETMHALHDIVQVCPPLRLFFNALHTNAVANISPAKSAISACPHATPINLPPCKTTPSKTSSRPSSRCKTTTTSFIARRKGR